jgi:putative ABC transport system permease protein
VLAIALVMASGIAVLVMSLTTVEALEDTAVAYYERYRFARCSRTSSGRRSTSPNASRQMPGVQSVETRIS